MPYVMQHHAMLMLPMPLLQQSSKGCLHVFVGHTFLTALQLQG